MMLEMQHFMNADGPKPVAPFNHAVRAGDYLFVTGQMPTDPTDPTKVVDGGISAQTQRVIDNLKLVLGGFGAEWSRIAMARVYITEFERDYAAMNDVWRAAFEPGKLPARTCIGVTGLAVGALVEIDLIVAL